MPQSRQRKKRKGGSASRSTYTKSNKSSSNNITKIVVAVILAALVVGLVIYFTRGGGTGGGTVTTASGLKYVDEVVGTGPSPKSGQNVTVNYTGTLENGTKFDSSFDHGQPFTFPIGVGKVIKGWDEGVMTMKVGGKRRLMVPSNLGYGPSGNGTIPPNASLNFEVELLDVK